MAATVTTGPGASPAAVDAPRHGSEIGGPVPVPWREGTLTRVRELESLLGWSKREAADERERDAAEELERAVRAHLAAAREAATAPRHELRSGWRIERAISNLDAAEADMLQLARPEYLIGQIPNILNHVQRHLAPNDPRRREVEWLADRLAPSRAGEGSRDGRLQLERERLEEVAAHRHLLVSAHRGASSVALREQTRVRSFRNVIVVTTVGMAVLATALVLIGWIRPADMPLCFAPQDGDRYMVVCPTEQSMSAPVATPAEDADDIDTLTAATTRAFDVALVAIIGLTAAAIAAAAAIRSIRGSSEPYGVPIALALLKLPTGAVTAIVGLLLMRGQFIPGLSALDSSAQIIAWAAIFGYSQQLFTRLVDQQAHAVLNGVRGGSKRHEPDRSE